MVKLVQRLPNGDRRIVRLLGPGGLAGLESLEALKVDHDAMTTDYLRVCHIPKHVIETLIWDTPSLQHALLKRWQ